MTAEQVRNLMPDLGAKRERYIKEIDKKIISAAQSGNREIEEISYGASYNSELARYYTEQGFEVHHYTSPWDTLTIRW